MTPTSAKPIPRPGRPVVAQRERDLAARILALPDKRYGVILADQATCSGKPELTRELAAKHCVLFLLTPPPALLDGFAIMAAWEFAYKTNTAWIKDHISPGLWTREKHELLLVGTRGKVPAPAPGTQWPSSIKAPADGCVKPERFFEMIEQYFPNLPKIELFAPTAREGWDRWGTI